MHTSWLALLFGALVVLTILVRAALDRAGIPALVGYLAIGLSLRLLDDRTGALGRQGTEVVDFLATIGIITLLFRIGLESKPHELLGRLRAASTIWIGNVTIGAAAGYAAARYLLGLEMVPSLVVATAMTATSVGIPAAIWRESGRLDRGDGELFLDTAELDDISGVMFMAILFSALAVIHRAGEADVGKTVATELGVFLGTFAAFAAGCFLFARYVEKRFTGFFRRFVSRPALMLVVTGTAVGIAALAGLLGLSLAIGALLAGLAFSRDPQSVRVDASFTPVHDLFTPFFFIGIGLQVAPGSLGAAAGAGAVLLAAAVVGKMAGTTAPALRYTDGLGAAAIGVSMVPRAEITMLIMRKGRELGDWAVPPAPYAGMVLVCAATCIALPPVLRRLLKKKGSPA